MTKAVTGHVETILSNPMALECTEAHIDELQGRIDMIQTLGQSACAFIGEELQRRDVVIGGAAVTRAASGGHASLIDPAAVAIERWAVHAGSAVRLACEATWVPDEYSLAQLVAQYRQPRRLLTIGERDRMERIAQPVIARGTLAVHTFRATPALVENVDSVMAKIRQDVHRPDIEPNFRGQTVKLRDNTALVMDADPDARKRVVLVDIGRGRIQPAMLGYEYIQDAMDEVSIRPTVSYAPGGNQEGSLSRKERRLGEQYAIHTRLKELDIIIAALARAVHVVHSGTRI